MAVHDIKTKDVLQGTIKTVDRTALAGQRMKDVYIQTKHEAEHSLYSSESNSEEYAANQMEEAADTVTHNTANLGRHVYKSSVQKKHQRTRETSTAQLTRYTSPRKESPGSKGRSSLPQKSVRGFKKQAVPIRNRQTRLISSTSKAIKTTEQVGRSTIKTAEKTARAAKISAHAIRTAAKATANAAKAAAAATAKAIKAIIAGLKALITAIIAGGWVAVVVIIVICMVGLLVGSVFGIFFSGEKGSSGITMSQAVKEINTGYETQLDIIKQNVTHDKLEMSGSRAVWREVLAVYAVKTTTDPNAPQEVATMDTAKKTILQNIFWQMNVISYHTKEITETVIFETDDGKGNIKETETTVTKTVLYISVTHKTAAEMATAYGFSPSQREKLSELLSDENQDLWNAVLYGIGPGDDQIVKVALSQLGNSGGMPYWSWYGFSSRVEWCACFVSWCANECGYIQSGIVPKFSSCANGVRWFQERSLWQNNSYEPSSGDIVFFDWENEEGGGLDGGADHVGIVEKCENGIVYTIEGNSGDACRRRQYRVGHYEILGYGTPDV